MKYEDKKRILNEMMEDTDKKIQILDGFESALIGYDYGEVEYKRAIYDIDKCIQILMKRDGMSRDTAIETFDYNVVGSLNPNDKSFPILMKKF